MKNNIIDMLSLILDRYIKNPKLHNSLIKYSFFAFNGLTTGIVFNDALRIFYGDFKDKSKIGYALGAGGALSGYVDKRLQIFSDPLNNVAFSSGFMVGNYWANKSEKGEKIV
jgi:hypothetical protein